MVNLSTKDFEEVLCINDELLGCRSMDQLRASAMSSMRRVLDADSSVFFGVTGSEKDWNVDLGQAYGADEADLTDYHNHYMNLDPFLAKALDEKSSQGAPIITSNRLVNYRSFERTEFYNDFFRPISVHSVLGITLHLDAKPIGLLAVHRPRSARHFTQLEQAKARLAVPGLSAALQRVMSLEEVFERDRIIESLALELNCEGLMILDSEFRSVLCDVGVHELLKGQMGKTGNTVDVPNQVRQLCRMLAQEPGKNADSLTTNLELALPDGEPLSARVRQVDTGSSGVRYIVYLERKRGTLIRDEKLKALGLTKREIDIVHLVGVGQTSAQIACNLCISARTVENHLRSIYAKLGVHNRTSLIHQVTGDR
ncbi:MAG: hypothetical protein CMM74_15590 [Rhodospirillaceae bacterium]|jgi:DNA-binding CsgD family transcriptional regulator|nr:hypothetical protein [Rhodospirillaceae bacterium]